MKNISLKIKKFSCLVLSSVLLIPNTIFAQNMDVNIRIPASFKNDITKTNLSLYEAQTAFEELMQAVGSNSSQTTKLLERYKDKAEIAAQNYFEYVTNLRSFERYVEDVSDIGVLKRLANQYAERQTKIPTVYNLQDNIIITHFRDKVAELTESNISAITQANREEISEIHKRLISTFEDDILLDYSKLHTTVDKVNRESAKIVKDFIKPEEVLLAAYEDLSKGGKIAARDAFNANLRLHQRPPTTRELMGVVTDIRKYLKKTNISGKPGFSFFRLLRELRGMNMAEREKYVAFLTDLTPKQKQLLKDIGTLENKATQKLTVKKMLRTGPLLIVGTILVATTITDVNAQNHFSDQTLNNTKLNQIANNIKRGDASPTVAMEYCSIPASESVVMRDVEHTMNCATLAMAKSAAEDDIDIIEDIVDNDPDLQLSLKESNDMMEQIFFRNYNNRTTNTLSL